MPRLSVLATLSAACLLGGALVACAGQPLKAKPPKGLSYECDPGGPATIEFSDQGYLPDSSARGTGKDGQPGPQLRSTAKLHYGGGQHDMVAEWTEQGLRYRSAEPFDGTHYLVWSQRAEDVRLGRRRTRDAAYETDPDGEAIALCRRTGRGPISVREDPHHAEQPEPHHETETAAPEPHRH